MNIEDFYKLTKGQRVLVNGKSDCREFVNQLGTISDAGRDWFRGGYVTITFEDGSFYGHGKDGKNWNFFPDQREDFRIDPVPFAIGDVVSPAKPGHLSATEEATAVVVGFKLGEYINEPLATLKWNRDGHDRNQMDGDYFFSSLKLAAEVAKPDEAFSGVYFVAANWGGDLTDPDMFDVPFDTLAEAEEDARRRTERDDRMHTVLKVVKAFKPVTVTSVEETSY